MTPVQPHQALMLVSADAGPELRAQVAAHTRPCPDYLRLEERHGVRLLDWTALGGGKPRRSIRQSLRHVRAAVAQLPHVSVIVSDGEHVGIPLALAMRERRIATPHLVIGHHLGSPRKAPLFRWANVQRQMDRIVVHSPNQVALLHRRLRLSPGQVQWVPFGVDTDFWSPQTDGDDSDLVVATGREHRDYETLVTAVAGECRLFISDSSAHSPHAWRQTPQVWPEGVERRSVDHLELRRLYDRAGVVVLPLVASSYPFGITSLLEAMSMGKAVVVSDTEGLRGIVQDGHNGIVVPPHDVVALRDVVTALRRDATQRERLGKAARQTALERFALDLFVDELGRTLNELKGRASAAAPRT